MNLEPFILEQCYAHGIDTYPEEACGFISGPIGHKEILSTVHRMTNVMDEYHALDPEKYPGTNRAGYIIDPEGQIGLDDLLTEQSQEIRVIYHTHVDIDAFFSETDTRLALLGGEPGYNVPYLVCSIKNRQPGGAILAVFNPATKDFDVVRINMEESDIEA